MNRLRLPAAALLATFLAAPATAQPGAAGTDQLIVECAVTMRYIALGRVMFVDLDWVLVVDFGRQTMQQRGSSIVFALTVTPTALHGVYADADDRRTVDIVWSTRTLRYSAVSLADRRTGSGRCIPAEPG